MATNTVNEGVEVPALSVKAYDHLIRKLLARELVPGDLINRRQIAMELRISVAPVLEAMVQLENDGFLQSIPRTGTLVRSIKSEDLRGQIILREALECEAARFFCGRKIMDHAPRLRKLAEAIEKQRNSQEVTWKAEIDFHRALVELADCPALLNVYDKVMRHQLFMAQNLVLAAHADSGRGNHHRLLKQLETKNGDLAGRAIRRHIRAGKTRLLKLSNP